MTKMKKKEPSEEGFPQRLRKMRMQKELSQSELAKIVGIHFNQISRYEKGSSQPTIDKINRLAGALDVSGDYLINGDTKNAARADLDDRDILNLFQEVQKLSEQDKVLVKRFINALLNQNRIEEMATKSG